MLTVQCFLKLYSTILMIILEINLNMITYTERKRMELCKNIIFHSKKDMIVYFILIFEF